MTDLAIREDVTLNEAMELVQSDDTPVEDRAAMFAVLVTFVKRVNAALGTYVRSGPTAKSELTEYLVRNGEQLGPLYIGWEAYDVAYPVNDAANWTDEQVQSDLEGLPRDYVRAVPAHLEIDVAALGAAVHEGSRAARAVWDFLKQKRYRTEGGKRAVLKVREPKKGKAAA